MQEYKTDVLEYEESISDYIESAEYDAEVNEFNEMYFAFRRTLNTEEREKLDALFTFNDKINSKLAMASYAAGKNNRTI